MRFSARTSQQGFSLVELMVVVAIIGILATVAIPNINKYMAKSRQSEVKTNLSAIYTAEKAFFAEYTGYYGGFKVIGYAPEGKLRYDVGFSAVGTVPASYSSTLPGTNPFSSKGYCGTGSVVSTTTGCIVLSGTGITNAAALASATTSGTAFNAKGAARLMGATDDIWEINASKVLNNISNGID